MKMADQNQVRDRADEPTPPPPVPAVAAGGVVTAIAVEEALKAAAKVIDMIRDKEIRERAQTTINSVKVEILEAAYAAERNYRLVRKKLKPSQREEIEKGFQGCEEKLKKAVEEAQKGADAANAGKEEVAKDHFGEAEKLGHQAADEFKKLKEKKDQMIIDNAPNQPEDRTSEPM
jgi:hypothetical protein